MGFFDKIKSQREIAKEEIKEVPWNRITTASDLGDLITASNNKPVAIFKHSTRCGISRMVLRNFERSYDISEDKLKLYFLDLLQNRDLSSEIANRFGVPHESPQIIVLKNGAVVHQDSHQGIDADHLKKFI